MNQDTSFTTELSLRDLQKLMLKALVNPLTIDQKLSPKLIGGEDSEEIATQLMKPNNKLTSFNRLEIYCRQYWFRLLDCLYDDFPGVRSIIGDKKFYDLSVAYLTRYPSTSYSLRDLGSKLYDFLVEEPEWMGKYKKAILNMVSFEWAQIVAFDGPAFEVLQPEKYSPEDLAVSKLYLQPYITLLKLDYPLDDFVLALRKEAIQRSEASTTQLPKKNSELVVKLPKKATTFLVVHRFDNSLYYKRIDKASFVLLNALKDGFNLAEACKKSFKYFPKESCNNGEAIATIQKWFKSWSTLKWFCLPPKEINS